MMDFVTAVKTCFMKYADFKGRARRSEYWWFCLFCLIVMWVFNILGSIWPVLSIVSLLVSIVLMIPSYSVQTRRLHDTGRSGWWVVIMLVLMIAFFIGLGVMMFPYADRMMEITDNMETVNVMMDAMEQSPVAIGVMGLCSLLMTIVTVVVIIFSVLDSKWDTNKYGPSPKYQ